MTDRERKDFYLKRIKKILMSKLILNIIFVKAFPKETLERLEEELKIIVWNNSTEWAEEFIKEEVVPLLKKHGIRIEGAVKLNSSVDLAKRYGLIDG